jgi:glycosyltransferase involved in cell wall biosynthesis
LEVVENLTNKDKIKFYDFVPDEDLPGFYNLADLFVSPSLYEGFGLPVLEAMACGCPLIISTTGCTKEVTADAALLTNPYNVNAIAEKIELLLTQPELRNDLIKKGLSRVKSFSWGKCAAETINLFHSLDFWT